MSNKGYFRHAILGQTCGHSTAAIICAHRREAHKYDEVDDVSWCDECWSDEDPRFHEIAYHFYDQGVFSNA